MFKIPHFVIYQGTRYSLTNSQRQFLVLMYEHSDRQPVKFFSVIGAYALNWGKEI